MAKYFIFRNSKVLDKPVIFLMRNKINKHKKLIQIEK